MDIQHLIDRLEQTLDDRIHITWANQSLQGMVVTGSMSKELLLAKCTYAKQMASALAYLHSRNIIYRDFKPSNVGFTYEDTVNIFDFGLARILPTTTSARADTRSSGNDTFHMSLAGTTRYMASEILLKQSSDRYEGRFNTRGLGATENSRVPLQE